MNTQGLGSVQEGLHPVQKAIADVNCSHSSFSSSTQNTSSAWPPFRFAEGFLGRECDAVPTELFEE